MSGAYYRGVDRTATLQLQIMNPLGLHGQRFLAAGPMGPLAPGPGTADSGAKGAVTGQAAPGSYALWTNQA
jgi:hypothetical protein